jgi:hypothetical protein
MNHEATHAAWFHLPDEMRDWLPGPEFEAAFAWVHLAGSESAPADCAC